MLIILHQVPKLPPGSKKRKLSDNATLESVKRMKVDSGNMEPPVLTPESKGKGRATVTLEDAEDDEEESVEEFAPGNDADYFVEEDEDGRFFGGGLTAEQKKILSIFEGAGDEGVVADVSLHEMIRIYELINLCSWTIYHLLVFVG